jgi:CBS domain-containing protein
VQPVISPDSDIGEALKMMSDNNLRALAVVKNGKLVGLLTLETLACEGLTTAVSVLSNA